VTSVEVVIPALNEEASIAETIRSVPVGALRTCGYDVEVLIVDNGSTDRTAQFARQEGAHVLVQPVRGYGNAYKAGFANCNADIIATGDADLTYPFDMLPEVLAIFERLHLEFLSTDRLLTFNRDAMTRSHVVGNFLLSAMSHVLYTDLPFRDSQSGMWVFRRYVWDRSSVRSPGMAFSQELKVEAFRNGFRCAEIPIEYRTRGGQKKLRTVRDGARNASQLLAHRLRARDGDRAAFRDGGPEWHAALS
jgi:glycosyltransferase involved in cell wall biosynthesis